MEIFLAWCDEQAAHVQCTWRYNQFVFSFCIIAVRAMLLSGEYQCDYLVFSTYAAFLAP